MDTPIACSLSGPDFAARKTQTAALARAALRERRPIDGGQRLAFAADDDVEAQLREIVAAEAACCPFLTMQIEHHGTELQLRVTGPADAQPIIAELFA